MMSNKRRAGVVVLLTATTSISLIVIGFNQKVLTETSEFGHVQSELERAGAPLHRARSNAIRQRGFDPSKMDKGLDTITSDTVWENGSPQNSGWTEGEYSTGTGIVRDNQYSWWQRHLLPQADYEATVSGLNRERANISGEDDADDPGEDYGEAKSRQHPSGGSAAAVASAADGGPVSYRGPGFSRLSP